MKRGLVIALSFLLAMSFVLAVENSSTVLTVDNSSSILSKVSKAYTCLDSKILSLGCSGLSTEEKSFVAMANGKCVSELNSDSKTENDKSCWPKDSCKIKSTALAALALSRAGSDSTKAQKWLFSQNISASDLVWYLQVDTNEESVCNAAYKGQTYGFTIYADKTLSANAGTCLSRSEGNWWFKISSDCYDTEFEISCNKGFLSSLLFKKKNSQTIHVPESSHSGSAESRTKEKVVSSCFGQGSCNYEGTLWASLVLSYLDKDVSSYLPYLISYADENKELLPESFLYYLTGYDDFRSNLLQKQKSRQYWLEGSDKFYDTAIALLPLSSEEPQEKSNTINWLLEKGVQDDSGCWRDNVRNTAFLLYSVWPRAINIQEKDLDCSEDGYFCMVGSECTSSILKGYSCPGVSKCCETEKQILTCIQENGELCSANEECDGSSISSSDSTLGKTCCLGTCTQIPETPECELQMNTCRYSCNDDEVRTNSECFDGFTCCEPKPEESSSLWWLWLLLVLIILAVLGFVFKEKIKMLWLRMSTKKSPPQNRPATLMNMPSERRILPPAQLRPQPTGPQPKKPAELDDVLKKLKDMGK